jgi:hypothetical protein
MANARGAVEDFLEEPPRATEQVPARRQRDEPNHLDLLTHRQLIGYLGVALPLGVYVLAGYVPTRGLDQPWQVLDSISTYYYTGAGNFFEGTMFGIGLFLVTYPGYRNVLKDRIVAKIGGLAALGVALFPTKAPTGLQEPSWWSPMIGHVHVVSAVILFGTFAAFALWLFPKSDVPRWGDRPPEKRQRDVFSYACGALIVASMLWIAWLAWEARMSESGPVIVLPEGLAIMAFAFAWLAKGEARASIARTLRQMKQMAGG